MKNKPPVLLVTALALLLVAAACTKHPENENAAPKAAQEQTQRQPAQAQDGESAVGMDAVPAAVTAAFRKAYPSAKIKGTSKEIDNGATFYEIESIDGKQHRDVSYRPDGSVSAVEETIQVGGVPGAVVASVQKKYPGATVTRIERVTKGGNVTYELVVQDKHTAREVVFGKDGTVLHEEMKGTCGEDEEGKD